MSGFTTVKDSVISDMKRLSKEILELEDLISFGIGDSDIYLKLRNYKIELNELIKGL